MSTVDSSATPGKRVSTTFKLSASKAKGAKVPVNTTAKYMNTTTRKQNQNAININQLANRINKCTLSLQEMQEDISK